MLTLIALAQAHPSAAPHLHGSLPDAAIPLLLLWAVAGIAWAGIAAWQTRAQAPSTR